MSQMNVRNFHGWLVLSIACICLSACQAQLEDSLDRTANGSKLSDALVQQSDFLGDWRWTREGNMQRVESTSQNPQVVEQVMRTLRGDYGAEKYYFTVAHILESYEQHPPQLGLDQFRKDMGLTSQQSIRLNLKPFGTTMVEECWKGSKPDSEIVCKVIVTYQHLNSDITVYAPVQIDETDLAEILDHLLSKIDQRIKAIDE
jgi:hypothetical protein